jgi:tyrosine-specific transport protein
VRFTQQPSTQDSSTVVYQVAGGKLALITAGTVGMVIIAIQIMISGGLLPSLG